MTARVVHGLTTECSTLLGRAYLMAIRPSRLYAAIAVATADRSATASAHRNVLINPACSVRKMLFDCGRLAGRFPTPATIILRTTQSAGFRIDSKLG